MKRVWTALLMALVLAVSTTARADEASHRKAAEDLLEAMDTRRTMEAAVKQTIDLQVQGQPALRPHRDVMEKFFTKYMSYDSLKGDLVKIYTGEFTEAELKELTAFYRSPVGKKLAGKSAALFQKGAQLGAQRVRDNLPELRKMIEEAREKP